MLEYFCILTGEGVKTFGCGGPQKDVFSLPNWGHYHMVLCSLAPGQGLTLSGKRDTRKSPKEPCKN